MFCSFRPDTYSNRLRYQIRGITLVDPSNIVIEEVVRERNPSYSSTVRSAIESVFAPLMDETLLSSQRHRVELGLRQYLREETSRGSECSGPGLEYVRGGPRNASGMDRGYDCDLKSFVSSRFASLANVVRWPMLASLSLYV